jgi:hypothetical protein
MGKEKVEQAEGVGEGRSHKVALGARIVAPLSVLFLVPVVRKLREQRRHHKHRRHFPLVGH